MKSFKSWLSEDGPTNSSTLAIRGIGNVSGFSDNTNIDDPTVTGYAADNARTQADIAAQINGMATTDGGDQPKNILGFKPNMKKSGGTANYTGKK